MANAYGLISHSTPCIRWRNLPANIISRSGFYSAERITERVFRCSAAEGINDLASPSFPSNPPTPRLVAKGCKLVGCGSALPQRLISNDDLAQIVETSDEWISVRTGIRNRRILSGDETLTGLAVEASTKALQMAQVEPDDVDLILLCTSTPDDLFGSGPQIQKELGCRKNPLAFDIRAACSGFVLGLMTAGFSIRAGGFQNVLVIGADALSRYVDWTDRGTCILFGDAAGAVLVQILNRDLAAREFFQLHASNAQILEIEAQHVLGVAGKIILGLDDLSSSYATDLVDLVDSLAKEDACDGDEDALLGYDVHSDGNGQKHLNALAKDDRTDNLLISNGVPTCFPRPSSYSCIQMNGKEVFRFAVRCVPQSIEASLERAGLTSSSIDWLLLHQANQRIIDAVATRLQIPPDHVISNLANYGNTSAASIPLALDEAVRSGKVQAGNVVATAGFGAGVTWGSAIVKWG